MLPLLGQIAAGAPLLAEGHVEELLPVPELLTASGENFLLRVRGESMIDDGIHNGDYVVVRRQDTAENGEIIAALVDGGEATVKRIYREKDRIRLQPANQSMAPDLRRRRRRARSHRGCFPEDPVGHTHARLGTPSPAPRRSPPRSPRRSHPRERRRCATAPSAVAASSAAVSTRIVAHAGVRSATCMDCESVLEAHLPIELRWSHPSAG